MAYCLPTDVIKYLGIDSGDDGTLLTSLIAAAQSAIDAKCHRTFEAAADTVRHVDAAGDHLRGATLYINHVGELCQITTLKNGDGVIIAITDYVTTPRTAPPFYALRLKSKSGLLWRWDDDWEDAIEITGRWAYSITPPASIKQACIMLAAFYYRQKDVPFQDVTAVEQGVVIRPVGMPAAIMPLLAGYIKP
jgi:hypothetical protein